MATENAAAKVKRFLYVNRRAPHGTIYAQESLETILIGAAFDQDVSVLFLDDGVYQLKKNQSTDGLSFKNFSKTFRALEMYEVEKLYVEKESLKERGMTQADLIVDVEVLTRSSIGKFIDTQDVVLSF